MTVVDERARVPPIDGAARERLAEALDRDPVVAAMLIGSQAAGSPGPLSDVDVGIWHDPGLDPARRAGLRLNLMDSAARALGTGEVDIVLLNDATPLLRHRAIRDGRRLLERDPAERVRLETRALLEYLDTASLRTELGHGVRRRIAEGRFGRR
ncbi:MAG TPA: nucleotidyltransferase domain-containing protein [Solirubrobacterales bacterium]|nr:nucleotidyltransferase domain-containing protein [Solirubrobacterales bacterium]